MSVVVEVVGYDSPAFMELHLDDIHTLKSGGGGRICPDWS